MASANARYHIVFNGEIYNHLELRRLLPPKMWRGHSDTETVLACLVEWGVERTLQALTGMFALAAYDRAERRLILARDRFGEKPLYYGYAAGTLVFASELKALLTVPGFEASIDRQALSLYMRMGYVPAPHSIYSSMRKLMPASWIEVDAGSVSARSTPKPTAYWSAVDAAAAGERAPVQVSDSEAVAMLDRVLADAVKGQMISDVPLGAFLSGGIDSSTIVALMQAQSSRPVQTFSIGFEEAQYDESVQARAVAAHLGTQHTELIVRANDALALVPAMPRVYDEPFADSSQLPTLMVAQLARRHVTVALSGDGGDELFAGYNRYFLGARWWPRLARLPRALRLGCARGLCLLSPRSWDRLMGALLAAAPSRYQMRMTGDKILKVADALSCRDGQELYQRLVSQSSLEPLVLDAGPAQAQPEGPWTAVSDLTHRMMLLDALTYLPDDILVKVDRAAMSVSLETRVPFLDHKVFELAWRLPMRMKVRDGRGKWLLRQLLYRYVPQQLVERPKMGFAVPLDAWLRGPLRDWAEHLLGESRLRQEGFLDAGAIQRKWREHLTGRRNWQYQLWNVLMFEAWLESAR